MRKMDKYLSIMLIIEQEQRHKTHVTITNTQILALKKQ